MRMETLADKIAKKTFDSPDFQKSWMVHIQAFGPILEPAFAEDYQSRIHLTAALNHISRHDLGNGLKKLQSLQEKCVRDADKAAFLFFMGVCFEMAGQQERMLECYNYANEYNHAFYMPYVKTAKIHLVNYMYDMAEKDLRSAIACFNATGLDERDRLILGTAYTNLATCLMMMHRYDEAEKALATSRNLYPDAPGRTATEVTLHALRGNAEQLESCLDALKTHTPELYDTLKEKTDKILARTDPFFFPAEVDRQKIADFWHWFAEYEAELKMRFDRQEYEEAVTAVAERLLAAFPFLEEQPYIALGQNAEGYVLELHDMYIVAIVDAYEKLLQDRPQEKQTCFQFVVVH